MLAASPKAVILKRLVSHDGLHVITTKTVRWNVYKELMNPMLNAWAMANYEPGGECMLSQRSLAILVLSIDFGS